MADLHPGMYVGRYLVIDWIGTGGMGSVYRAYDPKLNRNVAVKLIRIEPGMAGDESRRMLLLREAQALARVVHPHVVSVFDAGEFCEHVFFAMELIEGSTLRDVLLRTEHDPRKLLRLLDEAGRGLAAAHDAGLVHRDFKPENVLIDREQHAKVVDFGLARAIDAHKVEELVTASPGTPSSVLDRRITETGECIGTPAYMAPEQYLGLGTDARSDQFSFSCVAYEALFGRHPFFDGSGGLSMIALCAGKFEAPSRRLDPGYLRVLGRGLSRDPAHRYPSLQHLLDELARVPRRQRRRGVAIAALVCAATGLVGWPVIQKHRAQHCDAVATQALVGIWDLPRRAKVEDVLAGDGKAFGRDVWNRVAAALDIYSAQWKDTSAELCRSAGWWRAEDQANYTRASLCLDERRRELRAVTDVLSGGDREVRLHAPDILIQLDVLSTCTNTAALAFTPLPAYDRETAMTVERIRDLLAKSRALEDARHLAAGEEAAQQALDLAREQQNRALSAEALYRLGVVQETGGKYGAAETSLVQALADAKSSGQERLLALIWTQLLGLVGQEEHRPDEVEHLIPFIEATVERSDPRGPAHIRLLFTRGALAHKRGRFERAIAHYNAALEMARHAFGENDVRRIEIYQNLASTERTINQLDEGISHLQSALAETEALFGHDHPQLLMTLTLLARMLSEKGDSAGVHVVGQRALRIIEQASSPESPEVSSSLFELGMAYLEDGQPEVTLPLLRRSYLIDRMIDPRSAAATLSGIARAEEALGNLDTARTTFEESLALYKPLVGPGDRQMIKTGVRLGRLLRRLHRERDALQLCTQLRDAGERNLGPHGVFLALALSCVGEGYEQLGRLTEALATLERAEKLLEDETVPPRLEYRATVGFALARVLWRTGGDRERVRHLATEAADNYQHAGRVFAEDGAAVQTWLTKTFAQQR
ncbi:tetratricopeptide repeat protein [Pendulispora albinea]|uniref:Serine/threonine-protein kinase n=1 Tax=Pendulispora albinea TaxID=2741071 RepID=A0ABZ2M2M4_9BACT